MELTVSRVIMTRQLITYCILTAAMLLIYSAPSTSHTMHSLSAAQEEFARQVATRHDFDLAYIRSVLAQARPDEKALERIKSPAEALEWRQYRPIFLTSERIEAGVAYWRKHADSIAAASASFAVEPHILLAILGVESNYGEHTGNHRVLDALNTLAFDYPQRSSFFRSELEAFLRLTRKHDLDPTQVYGSYAGAMGQPQFIASSYHAYAVAADGGNRADLFNNIDDILSSIANYLQEHGWQSGQPVAHRIEAKGNQWRQNTAPLNRPVKPAYRAAELAALGIQVPAEIDGQTRVGLIELQGDDGSELWLTRNNFYALTRYNHSALYAMAIHQLAAAIKEQHE